MNPDVSVILNPDGPYYEEAAGELANGGVSQGVWEHITRPRPPEFDGPRLEPGGLTDEPGGYWRDPMLQSPPKKTQRPTVWEHDEL